jgi:hypothetical protein
MSTYRCTVTVYVNQGHSNIPYSPSTCARVAAANCYARSGGSVLVLNTCPSRVAGTGSWQSGYVCYVPYKCAGCFWVCRSGKGPGV